MLLDGEVGVCALFELIEGVSKNGTGRRSSANDGTKPLCVWAKGEFRPGGER